MSIKKGIFYIMLSSIISLILAASANTSGMCLGGLVNFVVPPITALLLTIIYLLLCLFVKNNYIRISLVFIFSSYMIYLGIMLLFTKTDPWIFWIF